MTTSPPFAFDYDPGTIVYGRGCIEDLGETLNRRNLERALIVCGSNVGSNNGVMDPVAAGLDDRLVGVFDETTPAKDIRMAYHGSRLMQEQDADVLICVGGGSTLDVAKVMALVDASDRPFDEIVEETKETGVVPTPPISALVTPMVVIPTTLAGADMSSGGGIKLRPEPAGEPPLDGETRAARFSDDRLTPEALFYDPSMFETTPRSVLVGSAMNGFDKGIETIYSGSPSAITDATAIHGLRLLRESVSELGATDRAPDVIERVVAGTILVQYGRQTSVIHAFGHGISFHYPVQQGKAHGVLAPHVLEYLLDRVDGRRELLATGLGIDADGYSNDEIAAEIVDAVVAVRDSLKLPSRLRDLEGVSRDHLPAIATAIAEDQNLERNPLGLNPDAKDIESVLERSW
ncbi:iron-containing alcohol dehydrogenase family protein [Natronorarus salvus]|uniref:iron-containing alcohol dehydrogenase family protein n=1 Tax=Natronorarus salvus TaxID=3117733 RepID=UPI002F25F68B